MGTYEKNKLLLNKGEGPLVAQQLRKARRPNKEYMTRFHNKGSQSAGLDEVLCCKTSGAQHKHLF